jgi:hypothetical protein
MTNPLAQDLGGVVRLLEDMTPGDLIVYDANEGDGWPPRPLWCFKNEAYDSGEEPALQGGIHYGGKEDADAIAAAVNFLRAHSAEIAGALAAFQRVRDALEQPDLIGPASHFRSEEEVIQTRVLRALIRHELNWHTAMQQGGGGG